MSIEPDKKGAARRGLAEILRELRRSAGLSGERLAVRCAMRQSKISRIEKGKTLPTIADVERILTALDVPADRARELLSLARAANADYVSGRAMARTGVWRRQLEIKALNESTAVLRQFLPAMPTGLLQVPEYIRLVMEPTVPSAPGRDVERAVQARLEAQSVLDDESRKFHFVMTEQAVRWNYAGREVMAAQVTHMATIADRPNVEIAILPLTAEVHDARSISSPSTTIVWSPWISSMAVSHSVIQPTSSITLSCSTSFWAMR